MYGSITPFLGVYVYLSYNTRTAVLSITEGQLQIFQRFSKSKLVLNTVKSRSVGLNYDGNGSTVGEHADTMSPW